MSGDSKGGFGALGNVKGLSGVVTSCQYCVKIVWCFSKMSGGVWGASGSGCVLGMLMGCQWMPGEIKYYFGFFLLPFPISISLSPVRSLMFFGVAGCPKSFTYQNVRVLRSFCRILKPWTAFWSWEIGFGKMAVAIEPCSFIWFGMVGNYEMTVGRVYVIQVIWRILRLFCKPWRVLKAIWLDPEGYFVRNRVISNPQGYISGLGYLCGSLRLYEGFKECQV